MLIAFRDVRYFDAHAMPNERVIPVVGVGAACEFWCSSGGSDWFVFVCECPVGVWAVCGFYTELQAMALSYHAWIRLKWCIGLIVDLRYRHID